MLSADIPDDLVMEYTGITALNDMGVCNLMSELIRECRAEYESAYISLFDAVNRHYPMAVIHELYRSLKHAEVFFRHGLFSIICPDSADEYLDSITRSIYTQEEISQHKLYLNHLKATVKKKRSKHYETR